MALRRPGPGRPQRLNRAERASAASCTTKRRQVHRNLNTLDAIAVERTRVADPVCGVGGLAGVVAGAGQRRGFDVCDTELLSGCLETGKRLRLDPTSDG